MSNTTSDFINIVDGESVILMRALRNHTSLSIEDLKKLVKNQFISDERFDLVLTFIEKNKWSVRRDNYLSLSKDGINWLDESNNELTVENEDISNNDAPKNPYDVRKLQMERKTPSIFQVLRKLEKGEIDLNPDFQRAFVWDIVRQSRLIESILMRIPLPAFYIDARSNENWNVVDGLQRLTTINKYCRGESFPLSGLQFLTELDGKRFKELPNKYQNLIEEDTELLLYNLMPGTPPIAKFTIFSRVNTGGMQLTAQEIRHALCQGESTKLLKNMAESREFTTATDGAVESIRMSDRELILRGLSFMQLGVNSYKAFNELDKFLLHAMEQLNNLTQFELEELEKQFFNSLAKVRAIFGRYAFRKFTERNGRRSPLNKALFEVWVVSVKDYDMEMLISNKERIIDAFLVLISPYQVTDFLRSISSSTSSSWAVTTRFSTIENLLNDLTRNVNA